MQLHHDRLRGKFALVTGAGSGIGCAIAMRFALEGARVAVVDVSEESASRAAAEIAAAGGDAIAVVADVAVENEVAAAVESTAHKWGGLDVIVANAGVQLLDRDARVDDLDTDAWATTLAVNLTGVFFTCKHGLRALLVSGGGCVICVGSLAAVGRAPRSAAYAASKGGVHALVHAMAGDYADDGIRVNAVVPGYTATPLTENLSPELRAALVRSIPLRRAATVDEIAAATAFLASEEASYVTGTFLVVDGGAYASPRILEV